MSVFFDGEKLCVQLTRGKDYKKVLELAKQYDGEYLSNAGIYVFPPIKKIARTLFELGYPFDRSAEIFLQKKNLDIPEELSARIIPLTVCIQTILASTAWHRNISNLSKRTIC